MTDIDICNMALSVLGHERPITALTDQTKEGKLCALWYAQARKHVLLAADWAGLTRTSGVVAGVDDGSGRLFAYNQQFKGDVLRLRAQTPDGEPAEIDVADNAILSEEPELVFFCGYDSEDPDEWPQGVSDAVVCELAARMALSLTGQADTATYTKGLAREALSMARALNANMTRRQGVGNPYLKARLSGDEEA
jgi:hypothetical protein